MGFRYDYILNQIEKACQLIATLLSKKKLEPKQEAEINQRLAELTGFQLEFFADEKNAVALPSVLNILDNDNAKAAVALLLLLKNEERYGVICRDILDELDLSKLQSDVRALVEKALEQ
jgi:uncharacterized membrane-anchored protein YjiN (DUF445 family)